MNDDTPLSPRGIPPQPTIAWFLRDLVPDELWNAFDIGAVHAGEIAKVQAKLIRHGGRDAWLRFVVETRNLLPQMLSISLYETLKLEPKDRIALPRDITFFCYPTLSVYAGGQLVDSRIKLTCQARFAFRDAGKPQMGDYALADTEIMLKHKHRCLIERVTGNYFVPVSE